jgi:hypothetical protein
MIAVFVTLRVINGRLITVSKTAIIKIVRGDDGGVRQ